MSDQEYISKRRMPNPASERAISYMCDLANTREYEGAISKIPPAWQETFHAIIANPNGKWAQSDVSKFIDLLKTCHPRMGEEAKIPHITDYGRTKTAKSQMQHTPPASLQDGMYVGPEPNKHIYKVYHTQRDIQVAKRLIIKEQKPMFDEDGDPIRENIKGGHVAATFKYEGRAPLKFLKPDMRMSAEAAQEFGRIYVICALCGRTLTDELSIHIGIGPICGNREFGQEFVMMIEKAKAVLNA